MLCDTDVLSAADPVDPRHHACADLLRQRSGDLLVRAPAAPETSLLRESPLGPFASARFPSAQHHRRPARDRRCLADYIRRVDLIEQYAGLGLGLLDASVIPIAGNRAITTLATLNARAFSVVRPVRSEAGESTGRKGLGQLWRNPRGRLIHAPRTTPPTPIILPENVRDIPVTARNPGSSGALPMGRLAVEDDGLTSTLTARDPESSRRCCCTAASRTATSLPA